MLCSVQPIKLCMGALNDTLASKADQYMRMIQQVIRTIYQELHTRYTARIRRKVYE